ncbi:MAG: hypothetical protein QOA19_04290 [Nitrososphaeraceae archaeon]|nr:hypothetical protein [Nitrososphaeraceae archaeon]MDW0205198.1 hypothetical protein [Nitrososphaeraceae archaeon]MDW0207816.1 hypothetical protein [Nitrososphaeraceae archaeon]MDW0211756.1 hypothetical protein [Nitrososphaeraceae archaeon]MDW0296151.1 hypothetical protein [Nitrososphaeraceae archaeon]
MKIKANFRILLLFGIFMISGVVSNTALAQIPAATGIGVKIDTPVDSANLPAGDLTIYGTSSDDDTTNCQVYADWNDLKPMQNVSANGPKGISDFSKWSFTYTSNYHNIIEGQNELTSKITCYESGPSASSKSYSINVTGTKAVSKNPNDTLQQTKEDTVAESSNILSVKSNNNDNNDLNDAAQQSNQENISNTDTEATNVDTDAKATNVDTNAKATNVDTDAKATNVDTDAKATNVDTDAKATNILPVKSNNTDSTPQQTNEDTDNEANNILPVENNKSNSGTYKILPLYSESNEKSTKSASSEGSDGTNVGSTGTVESEDGSNSKTIDTTDTGTSTTLGTQQEGQTEANTSPMSGSKISEGTDQSKVDSNTNTYFTYEPDLGEDQGSSNNHDHTIGTPESDNSISNFNNEDNSIFGLKFKHFEKSNDEPVPPPVPSEKSHDDKLEQKIEKLKDKIADHVHLFDLIG